ncbi:MAG TPA: thioredoxin domain-containing protein [Flavisolibacter sp.]
MSKLKPAVNDADHHLGNMQAVMTLVEYGDFECPHCGHAHSLIKRLLNERSDNLHFVFRNFPLRQSHPHAYIAAVAAEAAAAQGKFWEMHDLIFENQRRLSNTLLFSLAEQIGLNMVLFDDDFHREETRNKVELDFESGVRSGVNRTPTFFLNSTPVLTYDESYESLANALQLQSELVDR